MLDNPHIFWLWADLVPKKGFSVLLEAVAILNVDCTLVGDGALRQELEAKINALDIADRVHMVGPMPQPEIIELVQNAKMLVAPCVISEDGDRDGLPTVLLESMALGTPVISTQVAGIPELVQNENTGLCVPPQNPQRLAYAIEKLLTDYVLCQTLSQNARALIEREYDEDKNAAELREVFRQAIAQHSNTNGTN
ncbi:GDP-mannose-dependent alpha-(1-6)-phosphatidylinositol monomannoside mannosyltransferase [Aggregatibacter aphrophilus]|uniref:GDP-mannose-dependent alpha-(1-6)-phosphatidylinositol monomannoside mannosyltransferase n=2 Tax=Aggregatibacter aphrophilus TaxID=732 RepID=A0A336N372_AGGAP|nr:GDP-mannose-dependent alpha-(1-6)-phosphatidylinositol monomannoside mannosyltransferase [Aggregatibacter aphrophilus]VEF44823.1 GDP-mannose-dependent alpha-(1-6)-phosphatidylinositol monomannoside mannosyltransferase [Aggregatibacter aphrophilus ATCC 33389]